MSPDFFKCLPLSKKASSIVLITYLVWRDQISNPRPPAHGAKSVSRPRRYLFIIDVLPQHVTYGAFWSFNISVKSLIQPTISYEAKLALDFREAS